MAFLDCMALGGLHDCATCSLFFWFIYCEPYDESQICLALRKLQREWVLAFGAINYGIV